MHLFRILPNNKLGSAVIDTLLDGGMDIATQVYHNGWDNYDFKQMLQTGVTTMVTKLLYRCDPVCVSKGFLFQYREDLWFEDLYDRFAIARCYMSTFCYDGSFGKGWYHPYESFLVGEKGHVVCQKYPDGMRSHLQYDLEEGKTTITFDTGRTEEYFYNSKELVVRARFGEGREEFYVYDEWGNKVEEINRNGNKERWKFDAYGCILEEESLGGLKTSYTYVEDHLLLTKEDNCKGREEYEYDEQGNLVKEQ